MRGRTTSQRKTLARGPQTHERRLSGRCVVCVEVLDWDTSPACEKGGMVA